VAPLKIGLEKDLSLPSFEMTGIVIPSGRLCENFIGALRFGSGRADKYLDSNEAIAVRGELRRTMNVVFTQSGGREESFPGIFIIRGRA
jgi:hypothetical protein